MHMQNNFVLGEIDFVRYTNQVIYGTVSTNSSPRIFAAIYNTTDGHVGRELREKIGKASRALIALSDCGQLQLYYYCF